MTAQSTVQPTSEILWDCIHAWIADPDSSVEYAEAVENQIAVRMRQDTREASTIWWRPDHRSLTAELYLIPAPSKNLAEIYRLALERNRTMYRCHYALAKDGSIVIRVRVPNEAVTPAVLDSIVGEMYEQVEITFRPMITLAF